MNEIAFLPWLARIALGGGALLLVAWLVLRRLSSPQRQQRLGELAIAASLLLAAVSLAPAWLLIPVPAPQPPVPEVVVAPQQPLADLEVVDALPEPDALLGDDLLPPPPEVVAQVPSAPLPESGKASVWVGSWLDWFALAWAAVAGVLLARWLLANLAVWWLLRRRLPVPPAVAELFAEMAPPGCRLVVSDRVGVPFSVGLFRLRVVLPRALVERATTEELRWVLAHELTHLARQDTRTCWLFAIGQLFYFYLPWFWWLRREVRLCQEYVADAAAVEWAGNPADYARFLMSWAGRPMVGATGVSGSGSDLFRRVTMLLKQSVRSEWRPSRPWLVGMVSVLVALAVLAGGLGVRAVTADEKKVDPKKVEPEKTEPKKVEPKKTEPKKTEPKKDPNRNPFRDGVFPGNLDDLIPPFGGGLDPNVHKEIQQRMEEVRKQMETLRKQLEKEGGLAGRVWVLPGQTARLASRGQEPRLGAQVRKPSATLVDQLDLPKDQGQVLEEVGPNSAAAKAGLKAHDVLLELDGKPVSSKTEEFVEQLGAIKANTPVDAVVLRKGKKETIKGLNLPEKKVAALPALGGLAGFPGQIAGRALLPGGLGKGGMTSISRNNDQFTARHSAADVTITIKGSVDQGKATPSEIVIDQGKGQKKTYEDLDKVPAEHKEKVRKLLEMSGSGNARFPLR